MSGKAGWKHTEEARIKISAARKGKPVSEIQRRRIREAAQIRMLPIAERFWAKIIKTAAGCWLWAGPVDKDGYGYFFFDGKTDRAHQVAFTLTVGRIPKGLFVLHHCDTPACCRPDHLYAGTAKDNARDREVRGRNGWATGRRIRKII
ncbi:MAG TPA: hypothetical protein DCQ64_09375 [Candidatus Rokubacteria bacterium]|nr:hypothetical protein [Candidatus Rokubacteria bacterium]